MYKVNAMLSLSECLDMQLIDVQYSASPTYMCAEVQDYKLLSCHDLIGWFSHNIVAVLLDQGGSKQVSSPSHSCCFTFQPRRLCYAEGWRRKMQRIRTRQFERAQTVSPRKAGQVYPQQTVARLYRRTYSSRPPILGTCPRVLQPGSAHENI